MAAKELYSDQEAGNEESTLLLDPYEEEETLSLCDLPIYSAQWDGGGGDHFSKEDAKIFNNNKGDELFEFFSEEFTSSSTRTAENIIFCGKLIPFKAEPTNSLKKEEAKGNNSKSLACEYTTIRKVSLMRSTTKSRWFLFMFGMPKLSTTGMELRDMRNRQSRRSATTMFPAVEKEGKKGNCKGLWKMLKSMSMVLGCNTSKILANDVVKPSFL